MKCIIIETSPARTNAHPVTNEDGSAHIYGTISEARAELKANGYSYNRANQRYFIKGTEYRAYIIREDSEEYAHALTKENSYRAPAATKKQAEKQAKRYAISADINETRAYDEMQEVFSAIQRGDMESAETAAEWAKIYTARVESDAAKATKAAQEASTANAADWADQAKGRIEYARKYANTAAEEIAGLEAVADMTDREIVAHMVETIAIQAAKKTERIAAATKEDAREAWSGEGLYILKWSDGGQPYEPAFYETAEDLARDLASAYEDATDTHVPYADRLEYYERYELESFLGEPSDFDLEAIEQEATDTDQHGNRYWIADPEELAAIAERHQL